MKWNERRQLTGAPEHTHTHTPKTVWSIVSDENEKERERKKNKEKAYSLRGFTAAYHNWNKHQIIEVVWGNLLNSAAAAAAEPNSIQLTKKFNPHLWMEMKRTHTSPTTDKKNQFLCCCCCCCKTKKRVRARRKSCITALFQFFYFFIQLWKAEAAK